VSLKLLHALTSLGILLLLNACSADERTDESAERSVTETAPTPPQYLGASACRQCHEQQWGKWQGSQHDLALQQAGPDTVLAPFAGTHGSVGFSRDGDAFFITPDDSTQARQVVFTFGVEPLQQYVIEEAPGRYQTFPVPWDTRPAESGGQRWYELYPGDFPPHDPMHWTGHANNWNGMCADCHSTAVIKNYDPQTHSYQTRFAEADVACEACHGPGSAHVESIRSGTAFRYGELDTQATEINACAPCHSRRTQLAEGFTAADSYFDFYLPSLVRDGLYYPDGQILDEVYVYGSFLQSRMHLKGVTCSNCHDPHTAALKFSGNDVCTQCHNPQGRADFPSLVGADYNDASHHHHAPDSAGAACVNCHMDSRVYMGIDARRDHSFRIPRPDLSDQLGTPNACISCHEDQTSSWASEAVDDWFGERPESYGVTFAAAMTAEPAAEAALAAIISSDDTPVMVRASATALLANYNRGYTLDSLRLASRGSPLLQLGAAQGAASLSADAQWRLLSPQLEDDHLSVRVAAFSALLPLAADPGYAERLRPYLQAYLQAQALTRDFPATLVNIASAYSAFGDWQQAQVNLDEALLLQPDYVPALLNLVDLYRATLRDVQAEPLLQRALAVAPESADAAFSYALWLTRQKKPATALEYFRRAAELAPADIRYGYTLAIALNDSGDSQAAIDRLQTMQARWPQNDTILSALITILRDQQRFEEALGYLEILLQRNPANPQLQQLQQMLKAASA